MTDERSLEPDPQLNDDLSTWGIPPIEQTPSQDYFPNDTPISDEDVPQNPRASDDEGDDH